MPDVQQGVDPRERQAAAAERRERASSALAGRGNRWHLRLCRRLLATAQRYAPLREDGLADVGLAYPALRQAVRELGRRLADAGVIAQADDAFWLTDEEITLAATLLDRGEVPRPLRGSVSQRKAAARAAKRVTAPLAIASIRCLGREVRWTTGSRARRGRSSVLKGVAASPGRATATASVIGAPEDFAAMRTGDVLVAPLTTPAWTPLFARAGAIVTDVGGPLSHGSIVAREYGIPAVLGTGEATRRIRSGQIVTVDGSAGTVQLHDE